MEPSEYINLSWMEARKIGVSRKDWCAAVVGSVRLNKFVTPKKKAVEKSKFQRVIPLIMYSCSHRGDVKDMTMCASCGGGKRPLEIFECSVHGECTVDKMPEPDRKVKGLCKTCPDRQGKPII